MYLWYVLIIFDQDLQRWEVVGGAEKGGVVVRQGVELKSSEAGAWYGMIKVI